jgi:crossover junction endodeoxyribonuclease RusA
MIEVTLPWPPAKLNPNRSKGLHWGKRASTAKRYKRDCGWACVAAGLRPVAFTHAAVSVTFCPPDPQRRDLDNMLASIKAGLDAISAAVAIDDSLFELSLARGAPVAGGAVIVRIAPASAGVTR